MTNIKVTPEEVKENMQDVIVRTLDDFGKPCTYVTVRMKNGFTLRESTTCADPNSNFGKGSKPIPLICIETGERFPSFKDCSEKLDIPSSQISSAIKRRGTVHGYTLKKDVQNG